MNSCNLKSREKSLVFLELFQCEIWKQFVSRQLNHHKKFQFFFKTNKRMPFRFSKPQHDLSVGLLVLYKEYAYHGHDEVVNDGEGPWHRRGDKNEKLQQQCSTAPLDLGGSSTSETMAGAYPWPPPPGVVRYRLEDAEGQEGSGWGKRWSSMERRGRRPVMEKRPPGSCRRPRILPQSASCTWFFWTSGNRRTGLGLELSAESKILTGPGPNGRIEAGYEVGLGVFFGWIHQIPMCSFSFSIYVPNIYTTYTYLFFKNVEYTFEYPWIEPGPPLHGTVSWIDSLA